MRRRREPSPAELALWGEVARSVKPLTVRKSAIGKKAVGKNVAGKKTAVKVDEADTSPEIVVQSMQQAMAQFMLQSVPGGAPDAAAMLPSTKVAKAVKPQTLKHAVAMAPLERKLRTALKRGTRQVDAKMDLHGMRQDEAHATLIGFVRRSSDRGASLVLVVTGKGSGKVRAGSLNDPLGDERGVLRRLVPHWLRLPELRHLVIGFEEAHPNHGGAGALYVRLRRQTRQGDGAP
jgi:DNA-nicking Smr family endonuclease